MVSGDPMTGALLVAFNALIEVAAPDQVVTVLRHAVTTLLAEGPASAETSRTTSRTLRKHRTPWTGDLETWAPLRDRILLVLAARDISERELAAEFGIPYTTLRPSLLPKGHAPSQANIVRLQRWLEATENQTATKTRSNGHAYQLTKPQREQLAGYRQLDEQTVRHQTGVTLEVIDEAVAGHSLAPEIVDRLVNFLTASAA